MTGDFMVGKKLQLLNLLMPLFIHAEIISQWIVRGKDGGSQQTLILP